MRDVLEGEELDCRELYDLVYELPSESAFARAQGQKDLSLLFHEWAHTFARLQAGEKVTTPSFSSEEVVNEPVRLSGARAVKAFFDEHIGATEPDSGDASVPFF